MAAEMYKNLVFTTHALKRMQLRKVDAVDVFKLIERPARRLSIPNSEKSKFIGSIEGRRVHIVAAPLESHRWLIISVWVRGEDDPEDWLTAGLLALPRLTYALLKLGWAGVTWIFNKK